MTPNGQLIRLPLYVTIGIKQPSNPKILHGYYFSINYQQS